jgi:hypothetical protein
MLLQTLNVESGRCHLRSRFLITLSTASAMRGSTCRKQGSGSPQEPRPCVYLVWPMSQYPRCSKPLLPAFLAAAADFQIEAVDIRSVCFLYSPSKKNTAVVFCFLKKQKRSALCCGTSCELFDN